MANLEIQYVSLVPWLIRANELDAFKGQECQLTTLFDEHLVCALNLDFGNETDVELL